MVDLSNLQRIEYTILATALMEPDVVGDTVAALSPEDFSSEHTRGLFVALSDLHLSGAPTDGVSVIQRAGADYEAAVTAVLPWATVDSSQAHYCRMLKEAAQLRRVQAEATVITAAETLEDAESAVNRMAGLLVAQRRVNVMDATQAALDFYARQDATPEYLTWGMDRLNRCLYVQLGDMVVVGGYPSAGKTLLSIQFALELAQKYRVGYFSLETSPQKLVDRLMSHMAQVPLAKIKSRNLGEADWAAIAEAGERLSGMKLDFVDAGGMTVRDIQAMTRARRYQVILVDYLQLIADPGKGRYEQVTAISAGLHTLARQNNVACIALAQLSRPDKKDGKPQPPTMASFRESGQIEQDADVALLLWPSDPNDNRSRRVLKVGKNKEGERDRFELEFDGACQTLRPAEPTKGEHYRELHKQIRAAGKSDPRQMKFTDLDGEEMDVPF